MKTLVSLIALSGTLVCAQAQEYQFRDRNGFSTGSGEYEPWNNSWHFKDQYGLDAGSAEWNAGTNEWELKDRNGFDAGTVGP